MRRRRYSRLLSVRFEERYSVRYEVERAMAKRARFYG
jgi:hypothetical protein